MGIFMQEIDCAHSRNVKTITFRENEPFILQCVSDEMYLFYFDITFFWKMILNFRLLENNELICPFYAYFFVFENLDFGH